MKPMLASDYDESKMKFPCIAQPKIDGVRGININGIFGGRSLKQHANRHVTNLFSLMELNGFDGEVCAEDETHPDLCRLTTSALSTIEGQPYVLWWVFDYVTDVTKGLPYHERLAHLSLKLACLVKCGHPIVQHLRIIQSHYCNTKEQFDALDDNWLKSGYEGSIIRDPNGKHKQGRSTVKEGGLLRVKRFVDAEVTVTGIVEGEVNNNEARRNELGLQFRSSHQENMEPSGMIGAIFGTLLADVNDLSGALLFRKGQGVKISPGRMAHDERVKFWNNPEQILGRVAKFQLFPKGIKDKPRFATFQSFRASSDL